MATGPGDGLSSGSDGGPGQGVGRRRRAFPRSMGLLLVVLLLSWKVGCVCCVREGRDPIDWLLVQEVEFTSDIRPEQWGRFSMRFGNNPTFRLLAGLTPGEVADGAAARRAYGTAMAVTWRFGLHHVMQALLFNEQGRIPFEEMLELFVVVLGLLGPRIRNLGDPVHLWLTGVCSAWDFSRGALSKNPVQHYNGDPSRAARLWDHLNQSFEYSGPMFRESWEEKRRPRAKWGGMYLDVCETIRRNSAVLDSILQDLQP